MKKDVVSTLLQSAICRTTGKHRPRPTLFYFPGLRSMPLWDRELSVDTFPWIPAIEAQIGAIREEYMNISTQESDYSTQDLTREEGEHKMHDGEWSWHTYLSKGKRQASFAAQCPKTVELLENVVGNDLMTGIPFGFAFFSRLHAQSSIDAHSAPCNLRLRVHLPLIMPPTTPAVEKEEICGMRIAESHCKWEEGRCVMFDDSYEHEVWNRTGTERVLLLFDVWHPDLTREERTAISAMFGQAREKGWLS